MERIHRSVNFTFPIRTFLVCTTRLLLPQENELSSVITQTAPLECTHQELSFEWVTPLGFVYKKMNRFQL